MHKSLAAALLAFSVSYPLCTPALGTTHRADGASIMNSGSTNAEGYRLDLLSEGHARIRGTWHLGSVDARLVRKFFDDVGPARNSRARDVPCMKSASFGARTTVRWHGWTSPDLDCPVSGAMARLKTDVEGISASLSLRGNRGRTHARPANGSRIKTPLTPTPPVPTPYP